MKRLILLALFLLAGSVVGAEREPGVIIQAEDLRGNWIRAKTTYEGFNPGPHGRAYEPCQHEFVESQYQVYYQPPLEWKEDAVLTSKFQNLDQCEKCGTLKAPIRLKGEK